MARPCPHSDKLLPDKGKPYVKGACRVCWLFVNDRKARRAWDARKAKPSVKRLTPCRHLGDEIGGKAASEYGLDTRRRWTLCLIGVTKNNKDIPGIGCPCSGCGPKCEKYEAEPE